MPRRGMKGAGACRRGEATGRMRAAPRPRRSRVRAAMAVAEEALMGGSAWLQLASSRGRSSQLAASPGAATTVAAGWRMQRQATQERLGPSAEQRTAGGQRVETQKDGERTLICVPCRLPLKMGHSFT